MILERVTRMSLTDFAKEMEYMNIDALKQWILYEMSRDIPLKLDKDTVIIETHEDADLNDIIDGMLDQFRDMEEGKEGKI